MPTRLMDWTERRFDYDLDARLYPELVERIRAAPLRAADLVRGVPGDVLTRRDGEAWSIQENIGHLADLDASLWIPRLDQYDAGEAVLLPADMGNAATFAADHNARAIDAVLADFAAVRGTVVARLEGRPAAYFARTARHPRLDTPMRVIDLLFFKAEHDDHHLARARELLGMFGG